MPYLIDTDWMIDRLGSAPDAVKLFAELDTEPLAVSIVTYIELYEGVLRSHDPDSGARTLHALLEEIPVLPLTRAVARRCAAIRHALRSSGRRVNSRALDLIVAATALELGAALVTRNVDDYTDVPGLTLYGFT